ncbi:MAG: hypothetical protein ABI450_12165 [Rhizomicrobium sp.]
MNGAALVLAAGMLQAAPASPDQLAFGLEKLSWGMTPQAARGQYPALDGAAMEPGQPVSTMALIDHDAGPCRFSVMLIFERGRLRQVDFNTADPPVRLAACNAHVKKILQDRYGSLGGGIGKNRNGFTEYGSWGGKQMDISYGELDGAFIKVTFRHVER